MQKCKK